MSWWIHIIECKILVASNQCTFTTASQTCQLQTQETGDFREVSAMSGFPSLFRYFWNLWSWTNISPHSITWTYFGIIQGLEMKTTFVSTIAIVFQQKWNLKTSKLKIMFEVGDFPIFMKSHSVFAPPTWSTVCTLVLN